VQVEIKHFLESVYGLHVEKVNTLNVEGKKKRGKFGFFRWVLPACPAALAISRLVGRLAGYFALQAGKDCQQLPTRAAVHAPPLLLQAARLQEGVCGAERAAAPRGPHQGRQASTGIDR
jgi:hypothetical protein